MKRFLDREKLISKSLKNMDIYCYDILGSTNDEAKRLLRKGFYSRCLILADEQTAGRGRAGRKWESNLGEGLYMSLAFSTDIDKNPSMITMLGGIALFQALKDIGLKNIGIKWPNDIIVNNKKIAGILTELIEVDAKFFVIMGIGVNLKNKSFPDFLKNRATSLFLEGFSISDIDLAVRLVLSFEKVYNVFLKNLSLECFFPFLQDNVINVRKRVNFYQGNEKISGIVEAVNADGSLKVIVGNEKIDVFTGEFSIEDFYF